jgi:predicted alpha/beta hydrolase family esterase
MNAAAVLLLPGWRNSGPAPWQSRWQAAHGYQCVEQHDWLRPLRGDWIARLEDVLLTGAQDHAVVLVAHSLGCQLVAAWASHSKNTHRVKAALLVAPLDPEREALQLVLGSWSPVPMQHLPFASVLVSSENDPFCSAKRSQQFAHAWGADWVSTGLQGSLNADNGLGDWPAGHAQLQTLQKRPARQQTSAAQFWRSDTAPTRC